MFVFLNRIFTKASHMIKLTWLSSVILLIVLQCGKITAQDYQLVWSDEFDGTQLDATKWEAQIGNGSGGWGNNESEYYRAENAVVQDGYLTIIAKKEDYNGFHYTSARIRTIHKGDWKYGKFEIRAKMPVGKGMWPAIWMMPTDNVYGGWAASGEIDIMEYLGHDVSTVYGTLHYGGSWPNNQHQGSSYKLTGSGFNDDFHVFTLLWKEGQIQWLVDGTLYQTQNNWYTTGVAFPAPFNQLFHMILNVAVGGNWPGYPDASTQFPQTMVVDYVRVYQDMATGVNDEQQQKQENGLLLDQNYPNPFNSQTIIRYSLAQQDFVKLSIYDMLGRRVSVLVDETQNPGLHSVSFDASNLSSGIYTYCLDAGNETVSRKLILIK